MSPEIVSEGSVKVQIPSQGNQPSKSQAFYNPRMNLNRDLSMAVAKEFFKTRKSVKVCEPFAATGIRALRYAKEVLNTQVFAGDIRKTSINLIKKNSKLNKIKIETFRGDANELLTARKYDLIDLDPFGTPAPFIDSTLKGLKANGLLAATATDMMALCGVAPKAGTKMPKYDGACSMKCEFVHEVAVRLLLGLIAGKSKRIIKPVLSLSTDHYIRVFVKFGKIGKNKLGYANYNPKTGKRSVSKTLKKVCKHAGPLWIGKLWDKTFLKKLDFKHKLLDLMIEEANGKPLFYTVRELYKGKDQPKMSEVLKKFKATRTHFKDQGVRLK